MISDIFFVVGEELNILVERKDCVSDRRRGGDE